MSVRISGAGTPAYRLASRLPLARVSSRIEVVVDGGSLAQELGIHAHAEIGSGVPSRAGLERRDHQLAGGPGRQRAAHDDDRRPGVRAQRRADLLADAPHVLEIDVAVAAARRPDAHENQVGLLDRDADFGARREPAGADLPLDDLADLLLDDRRLARVDELDLARLGVDADHLMAGARQAPGDDRADVAEPQDADLHARARGASFLACTMRCQPQRRPSARRRTPGITRPSTPQWRWSKKRISWRTISNPASRSRASSAS